MKPIQFQVSLMLNEDGANTLVELIRRALKPDGGFDPQRDARLKSSRDALFAGQKPPEDQGLLIDTTEVTRLLNVSRRTVWTMQNSGQMPKPVRIGRAVRWSYDEIKEWVAAGCPNASEWKKMGK